jgi:hypothetical protein
MRIIILLLAEGCERCYNPDAMKKESVETFEQPDLPPTDPSGEVDLEQIRYNLSLTPGERLDQNDRWAEFVAMLRAGGAEYHERANSNG